MAPVERAAYERFVAHLRARLGEETFAAAWQEGRSMTPQQALAAPERAVSPEPVPAVPQPLLVKVRTCTENGLPRWPDRTRDGGAATGGTGHDQPPNR